MSGPFGSSTFNHGVSSGFYDHTIDQSLRFTSTAPILTRTFATGNRRTYTFSVWLKRAPSTKTNEYIFHTSNAGSASASYLYFSNDILVWYDASTVILSTNRRFRDFSSWYHIVLAVDTTDSTAGNRSKLYVNGVQETDYSAESNFSENHQTYLNSNIDHFLGSSGTDIQFNGYMAEVNFIDGQALTPSSFGQSKDGVWIPKDTSGLTFGTNGFLLPFGSTTKGASAVFDGSGDNIRFTNASQYDIASDDDFCLEFYTKGDYETNYSYGLGDYTNSYFLLQLGANGVVYGYYGNGQANTLGDMTAYLTKGTSWHHIAYVRESGTYRLYIDGVQRGTGTGGGTVAHDNARFDIGDAAESAGAPHLNGFISNLRFTVGAARYTGGTTFTVPTSTLTNDSSNVKLLAFTTSSITADGSSAGVTATISEGDPVFSADNPFSDLIGADSSGNNNDFTQDVFLSSVTNGIGFEDVVLDSPTNNFATMNPLFVGNSAVMGVEGEGNLKVLTGGFSSTLYGTISTFAIPKDKKIYIEVEETGVNGSNWAAGFVTSPTGLNAGPSSTNVGGASSVTYYNRAVYKNGTAFQYHSDDGTGGLGGGTNPLQAGDILGLAIDGSNGKVWFHKNGVYWKTISANNTSGAIGNTGNPSAGTDELATIDTPTEDIFFVVMGGTPTDNLFVNFGQDSQNVTTANSDANGIGTFEYAPPTDYVCLCAANLTDTEIGPNKSQQADDHFNTVLWTGNNSVPRNITGVGFSPDWMWVKDRIAANNHVLVDTVRGISELLYANDDAAGVTGASQISAVGTDGFTIGATTYMNENGSSNTYVGWNWKAGGTPTANNSESSGNVPTAGSVKIDGVNLATGLQGSLPATRLSANTKAGFSIVTYTGNNSDGATVAHGLTQKLDALFIKKRADNSSSGNTGFWIGQHVGLATDPEGDEHSFTLSSYSNGAIYLNATNAESSYTFDNQVGGNTDTFVAYCFHNVEGYSKFGSWEGNASASGPFVFTGFKPAFLLLKNADGTDNWSMYDNKRDTDNVVREYLIPNDSQAAGATDTVDFLSNGFRVRNASAYINTNNDTYIYFAFAEAPFKYANAR